MWGFKQKSQVHRPGLEPGYSAWKADIIAARPSVHYNV